MADVSICVAMALTILLLLVSAIFLYFSYKNFQGPSLVVVSFICITNFLKALNQLAAVFMSRNVQFTQIFNFDAYTWVPRMLVGSQIILFIQVRMNDFYHRIKQGKK